MPQTKGAWSAEIVAEAKATWTAWTPEVWQPLGIKDRTATLKANAKGEGGTRPAMLAVMARGFADGTRASQVAACIRHTYLGCKAINTNGILFSWFTSQVNLSTVASNAVFKADTKGVMRLVLKPRASTIKVTEKKASKPKALPSANGPVVVVRPADKALAEAAAGS